MKKIINETHASVTENRNNGCDENGRTLVMENDDMQLRRTRITLISCQRVSEISLCFPRTRRIIIIIIPQIVVKPKLLYNSALTCIDIKYNISFRSKSIN